MGAPDLQISTWLAIGVKSARKWFELFTPMIRIASASMPTMPSSTRSSSCVFPLTTAISTPSISRQALGPRLTGAPVIIGPRSVVRPSLSRRTLKRPARGGGLIPE